MPKRAENINILSIKFKFKTANCIFLLLNMSFTNSEENNKSLNDQDTPEFRYINVKGSSFDKNEEMELSKYEENEYKKIKTIFCTGFTKEFLINIYDLESYIHLDIFIIVKLIELDMDPLELLNLDFYIYHHDFEVEEKVGENIPDDKFLSLIHNLQKEDYIICRLKNNSYDCHSNKENLEKCISLLLDYFKIIYKNELSLVDNDLLNNITCYIDFLNAVRLQEKKLVQFEKEIKSEENSADEELQLLINFNRTYYDYTDKKLKNFKSEFNNSFDFVRKIINEAEIAATKSNINKIQDKFTNQKEDYINEIIELAEKFETTTE